MVRILESYLDGKKGKLVINVVDSEGELQKLIDHIKKIANMGHSFEVVVDPNNKDYTEKFYIDGDGSFYIKDVEFEKEDDEKIEKKEESIQPSGNIIEALDDMLKAMDNVTELWAKNPEWDDVLSNKEYPFEEDFDIVVKNISYWVEECKK